MTMRRYAWSVSVEQTVAGGYLGTSPSFLETRYDLRDAGLVRSNLPDEKFVQTSARVSPSGGGRIDLPRDTSPYPLLQL
jgi:hypothetical protein